MFEYLTEFWSAITEVVISSGTYTVDWFKSIGNAVAGAIGGMFNWLIHYLNDFFVFLGWVFSILTELIKVFVLPISYIFNFLKAFTISAFSSPQSPGIDYAFSDQIKTVFENIPYWNTILSVIALSLLVLIGASIFRTILKIP